MKRGKKRIISAACLGAVVTATNQTEAVTVTFRQGLNGYADTQDTWFSNRTAEANGFPAGNFVRTAMWGTPPGHTDGANQQGLVKFDSIFGAGIGLIPSGSTINSATFRMHVPSDITYSDGEANAVHQMLVDWVETDAFSAPQWSAGNSGHVDRNDIEAAATPVADSTAFAVASIIPQNTTLTYDVTSVVQSWSDAPSTNYGFLLQSLGLSAGNGLFMASSTYTGADGEIARPTLEVDFASTTPTVLGIRVNTVTGNITMFNETGGTIPDVDYYRITSGMGSLNANGWNSLEDQNLAEFPAGTGTGDGWEELGVPGANAIVEAFLQGSSPIPNEMTVNLGNAFMPAASTDELEFIFRAGGNYVDGLIEFVTTALEGDYNLDGAVNAADYVAWRDVLGSTTLLHADGSGNNSVGIEDYEYWRARFGGPSGSGSFAATAVPEPCSLALLGIGAIGLLMVGRRSNSCRTSPAIVLVGLGLMATAATATVYNERNYTLGDDGQEDADLGITLGSGPGNVAPGQTLDSGDPTDPPGTTFIDIDVVGAPIYIDATSRPGATPGSLGAMFHGSGDSLTTFFGMNRPSDFWDNPTLFPGADYPLNYDTLLSHGIQFWARPNPAGLGQSQRQDLVLDTDDAGGVFISAGDTWGMFYDEVSIDSGVPVDTGGHGWTHVMHLSGLADLVNGKSAAGAVLLINGVAVAASPEVYDSQEQELKIGSNLTGDDNFYKGALDELRIFLWGNNTGVPDGFFGQMGRDYGTINLGEDNDWIAQKLVQLNVTDIADVNLDGVVSGNGTLPANMDDVTAFIEGWLSVRTVNGVRVGDWISRQQGDLNYDGITDYKDAVLLHQGLVDAGVEGLNFGLLSGGDAVPEPTTCVLLTSGVACLMWYRGRNRKMAA